MTEKPRIAIIGAGPAGCILARLLLNASIPVTVFEGEKSIDFRSQGGTLDLHTQTGQRALREAGLYDEFLKYARFDGEALSVVDKSLQAYLKVGGTGGEKSSRGRPEIDRSQLRNIVLASLPEGVVRWGSRLRSVDPEDRTMHFEHGDEKGFDLLIGADGAWSKVRPLVSSAHPTFTGLGGFDLVIRDAAEKHPEISKFVNRGSIFAVSDGVGITIQQRGDHSLTVYAYSVEGDADWMKTCGYDVHDPAEVKKALLERFHDWDPLFKDMIRATDDSHIVARSMFALPVDHKWETKPGVTLIGDAAHLMSPFAGEGVNLAMDDALRLSREIIQASSSGYNSDKLVAGVKRFEADMNRRAAPMAKVSKENMADMFFIAGAPRTTIDTWVRRVISDHWLVKILAPRWLVRTILRWTFWW